MGGSDLQSDPGLSMVGVMESTECCVTIGDRVQVGDQRGTVLYVGPVPPTRGTWLGVDWDDPLRGKHNGMYEGIRYFHARYETSGSFVRLEKTSGRQSLTSAIAERYGGGKEQLMAAEQMDEIKRALNAPLFEMVGFEKITEKQSCFESLEVVSVRGYRVCSAGDPDRLQEMCASLRELDLSRNLFSSWRLIHQLATYLPKLEVLNLSENRMTYTDCNTREMSNGFKSLKFIVLSKMEYTWDDFLQLSYMWPQINQLQVSFNKITHLSRPPPCDLFQNLETLNLEGNNIVHWSEVEKLGSLPSLKVLNICNIGLTKISLPTPNTCFLKLKYILLSGNFISDWESISELDKLPKLNELRLRDNPILEPMSKDSARQNIIARIANLKMLNSQEIQDEERRGAEIDYLKENGRLWLETTKDSAARAHFVKLHPRYPALIRKLGEITEAEIKKDAPSLKANLVLVKFESKDSSFEKSVPEKMTLRALLFLVQRLFKTGTSHIRLTLISHTNPELKLSMDKMEKNLNYYSVENGDTIRVEW